MYTKIAAAFWLLIVLVMLFDLVGILLEKRKQSRMSEMELITYLMNKHGKDWQEYL